MRLANHVPSTLKKHLAIRTSFACSLRSQWLPRAAIPLSRHRHYFSNQASPERIAILGGGVTGLASAYFISQEFPNAKIIIFEAGKETGGWVKSRRLDVPGSDKNVLFELGPRTLRNATPTAFLVQELGLIDEVVYTKKDEVGAKNRYLYYPDALVRLPSGPPSLGELWTLAQTGILSGFFGILKEPWRPKRPNDLEDETIGSFLSRRVDKRIANNLMSAVIHGIYAGDIWQLSARRLMTQAWELEGKYGSALGGFMALQQESPAPGLVSRIHPTELEQTDAINREIDLDVDFAKNLADAAMYSFEDGLQTLVLRLKNAVETKGNVVVKTESPIQSFTPLRDGEQLGVQVVSGVRCNPTTHTL